MKTRPSSRLLRAAAVLAAAGLGSCSNGEPLESFDPPKERFGMPAPDDVGPPLHAPGEPHAYDHCDGSVCARTSPALLHSGEFEETAVDLRVPGVGLDFVWVRRYRSRIGATSVQGVGWDFSYDIWVEPTGSPDVMRLHDGFNQAAELTADAAGQYTAPGYHRVGSYDVTGAFVVTFADGGTWRFRPDTEAIAPGRIDAITDRNGNALHFVYDASSRLMTITDTLDRPFTVAYDANGFIASVTDFTGRQVTYAYYQDGDPMGVAGDLASVTLPAITGTSTGNDFPAGRTTTYEYTVGGVDPSLDHNLLTITNANGDTIIANTYGQSGLALDRLEQQAYGGPDSLIHLTYQLVASTGGLGMQTWVNDPEGFVQVHTFDVDNREISRLTYDEPANRLLPTDPATNVPAGPSFETLLTYNADHHVLSMQRPSGVTREFVYETASPLRGGNIAEDRIVAPDGHASVQEYEYDPRFGNDHPGKEFATSIYDATLVSTEQTFDAYGNRLTRSNSDPAQAQSWSYDARGRLVEHVDATDAVGHATVTQWEFYGPADGVQEGYLAAAVEDVGGLELTTQWVYDALGRSIERIDPEGNSTLRELNAADQIVREHGPLHGGTRSYDDRFYDAMMGLVGVSYLNTDDQGVVDAANPTIDVEYTLDVFGNEVEIRDELSAGVMRVAQIEYDRNQNVIVHHSASAVAGESVAETTHHTWGGRGAVSRVEGAGSATELTVTFIRDDDGHIVAEEHAGSGQLRRWETEYDDWDRMVTSTDPMGNVTRYEYDDAGRLLAQQLEGELVDVVGSAGNVLLQERQLAYDTTGRPTSSSVRWFDPQTGPGTDWVVDDLTLDGRGHPYAHTDARGATTYRYDDTAGRAATMLDPVGNEVHVTRDLNGQPTHHERWNLGPAGMTITARELAFDSLVDEVGEVSPTGATRTRRYDSRSNTLGETDGRVGVGTQGNEILHDHDAAGRVLSTHYVLTSDGLGSGGVIGELEVPSTWDQTGRLTSRTDPLGHTTIFDYDDRGHLASRSHPDGTTESFEHDAFGDVIHQVDALGTEIDFSRDLLGRITSVAAIPAPGVDPSTTWETVGYDGAGHIVQAADSDSNVYRNYDSLGNLVEETVNGSTTEASYDPYGKLETLVLPSGEVIDYIRDVAGRITSIEHDGITVAEMTYRGPTAVASRLFPEPGLLSVFGHAASGTVESVVHQLGGITLEELAYTLEPGDLVEQVASLAGHGSRTLAYDSVGRTTSALHSDPEVGIENVAYTYDANGSWSDVAGRAGGCNGALTIDPLNNRYDATPCEQITYDAAGSMKTIVPLTIDGRNRSYVYDYRQRLVEAVHDGPTGPVTTKIYYDALGRIHTTTTSTTDPASGRPNISMRARAYLGLRDVEHATNTQVLDYVFDDSRDGHVLLRVDAASGQRTYFAEDGLGSTILAVGQSPVGGWDHERIAYGDYGQPTFVQAGVPAPTSALGADRLFAGLIWHAGLDLYETGTRMLDPELGRFITVDMGGRWDDATAFGNGYVYAGSQPYTSTDRSGRWKTPTYYNGWSSNQRWRMENNMLGRAQGRAGALRSQLSWVMTAFASNRKRWYAADNLNAFFGNYGSWASISELRYTGMYTHNRLKGDVIVFQHRNTGWCDPSDTKTAWTIPSRHAWIRICTPRFWNFNNAYVETTPSSKSYFSSWNSAPGTVLHEASHNAGFAVDDKRYPMDGEPASLMNGTLTSYSAKHNAASIELAALDCRFGMGSVNCD